ncbi:suppressor of cytokine signaling 3a [Cyprinodon tularosa]|uniref:Suppressor of cytokine signaling 3a n=1 Tax=Cyprinodon variegatus TaxID=28743 RepID=A0A3Q2CVT7_CYPVA|nr:PREDICTED: suppressor of cytokine signaling 3-like [Cyprinodon variegatus]XP_038133357.1 suppressor of cytokine signaling 3a [Cyprinodon tularosa]
MVTYSKTDSAVGNCLSSTKMGMGYHFKTFVSEEQFLMVVKTLQKLRESDFFWSTMTGKQASVLLSPHRPGTFLIRESSDHQHLFTLSVKTETGTKNLRIQCDEKSFFLQTDPKNVDSVPHFDCVLKLINYYICQRKASIVYYISAGGERIPLELIKPLYFSMSTLQHLCRKTINKELDISSQRDQLPNKVQEYLDKYEVDI